MADEIMQTNPYDATIADAEMSRLATNPEPIKIYDMSVTGSETNVESVTVETDWQAIQAKTTHAIANAPSYIAEFFQNNRQLFVALGWAILAFLGIKLVFAGLDAIDDIPLVTPILKLIGLFYAVRFVWRYLLRVENRQELSQTFEQIKSDVFGRQS